MPEDYTDVFDVIRKKALPVAIKYSEIPELGVVINNIPLIGCIVHGYLNAVTTIYTRHTIKKLCVFLSLLVDEIEKEESDKINKEFFSSMEFHDLFFLVNAKVQRGIRNNKLIYLARLLKEVSLKEGTLDPDKAEEFIENVDSLSKDEMNILYLLQEFFNDKSLKYNFGDETIYSFLNNEPSIPDFLKRRYTQSQVLTYLNRLTRFGFLLEITGVFLASTDPNQKYFRATEYFKDFLNYIHSIEI